MGEGITYITLQTPSLGNQRDRLPLAVDYKHGRSSDDAKQDESRAQAKEFGPLSIGPQECRALVSATWAGLAACACRYGSPRRAIPHRQALENSG